MRILVQACIALLFATTAARTEDGLEKGRELATRMCAHCHAVGKWERSPLTNATPFRQMEARVDYDDLQRRLQDGLVAGHPAMPMFVFKAEEARALIVYLRAIRGP